ncbi:Gluconate transport-inducing protein [Coemansia sp. RSA 353]|nr:Gluconate transport-inducing protein [Coemansia sp. RSA 1591]KAJ1763845.1 Gluconate transport-inducing protein [Coemansia sp. RSA 1752]KAJ1790308.1 Gluconate transport-inducing protein [Coemansia sp. RSA 1938]KAJ1793583.1 Gluconate transport-inducing protein [Coemansia sp. RSA 2167]KAJ2168699.1 Gluconate transport-inducing protein [Coemansia sp. RSA 562]KAJ2189263.1 Gluconate transport-inducing protein [Coemansia sp. RSA 532]KAJ2277061.1 Gluconate transport-inducing protein [Coemansia sp. 
MGDTRMETYYGFVSTSEDALALFEACRLGYKQRVPRRLSDAERSAIRSGSVFVWEESESGMKRWTDGRSWSPSRVQGCFLTYHEWEGRRRAQRHPSFHTMPGFSMPMSVHGMAVPMGIARYGHFIGGPTKAGSTQVQYGFPKENGMLKKALSIRTTDGKRLHIIAYYSKEDHAQRRLLTPTTDSNFPKLVVPPNLYPDMSPESMYGASHSLGSADGEYGALDPPQSPATAGSCDSAGKQSGRNSQDKETCRDLQRPGHATAMDIYEEQRAYPDALRSAPQLGARATRRPSPLRPLYVQPGDAAVDALSAGLHKARVQSLLVDGDMPSLTSLQSRPAPELVYPHTAHPMSAPSSSNAHSMRPSSNSFSGSVSYVHRNSAPGTQYEAPLGLSTSSSSAPASTVMRSTAETGTAYVEPHAMPPMVSEATLMQAHSELDRRDPGRGRKYLGLGGPLGLGSLGARRATPLRSVTTAAVLVRSPYAQPRTSPARRTQPTRMHSTSHLPLLLSPINPPQLPGTQRTSSFSASQISLAGIRDAKEGPRRLPSISDRMHTPCSPGGLGIYNARSLLPSPMTTPLQSMPDFDTSRDSLSILATAADRVQPRHTQRNASGHPYMRMRRGPSTRSVSLKQSEDIRQLGVLDQSLKLK